jgi:hypothetical protein
VDLLNLRALVLPLDELRTGWTPERVGSAVIAVAATLSRPKLPTLPAMRDELRRAAKQVTAAAQSCSVLPSEVWAFALIDNPEEIEALLSVLVTLSRLLERARDAAMEEVGARGGDRGGRTPDQRLRHFVHRLALLFAECTGRRPTTTTNPGSGELVSGFDRFTLEAMRQVWPHSSHIPSGAVVLAIREAVTAERDYKLDGFDAEPSGTEPTTSGNADG